MSTPAVPDGTFPTPHPASSPVFSRSWAEGTPFAYSYPQGGSISMMKTKFSMLRHPAWMGFTALLGLTGLAQSALAEGASTPMAEMRAAAEALADVEPGPQHRSGEGLPPQSSGARATDRKALMRDAMREAVRSEVARERAALERPSVNRGVGAAKSDNAAENGNGNSISGQARAAAAQAQQAQRNNNVSAQHRQNQSAKGQLPANAHGVGQGANPK